MNRDLLMMTQSHRLARPWTIVVVLLALGIYLLATVSLTVEASEDEVLEGDVAVAQRIQDASFPGVHQVVDALNWGGQAVPLVVLAGMIALGLLITRHYAEMVLMSMAAFSHVINFALKHLAASPRPTPDFVRISDHASGFGFPSGHTMGTVVYCGIVIYLAWRGIRQRTLRLTVQIAAALMILGIGFSRIYSGAHWPSDVLGGYLWGAFYTIALVVIFHRLCPLGASQDATSPA